MKLFLSLIIVPILLFCSGCGSSNNSYLLLNKKSDSVSSTYKLLSFRDTTIVVVPDWIEQNYSSLVEDAKVIRLDSIRSITIVHPRDFGTKLLLGYVYAIPISIVLALGTALVIHPDNAQGGQGFIGVAFFVALAGIAIGETYAFLESPPSENLDFHNKDDLEYLRQHALYQGYEPEKLRSIK